MNRENKFRAERGLAVIRAYGLKHSVHSEEIETVVIDIIADMFHALNWHRKYIAKGFEYEEAASITKMALGHYAKEKNV